jgi:hypothetical protein
MNVSIIISTCALALTLYGLWATRWHNRLSVTPHLCSFSHKLMKDDGLYLIYELSNNGIGPARITKFILFREGREVPRLQDELFEYVDSVVKAHLQGRVNFQINHSFDFGYDVSMKAGETRRIVELFFPGVKQEQREAVLKTIKGLDARIEYQSFYGQKFAFDTRTKAKTIM